MCSAVRAAPNTVAVIDTRTDRVMRGSRSAVGVIAFAAGSVWVANGDDQTVSRVDPATLATVRTIALADPPTGSPPREAARGWRRPAEWDVRVGEPDRPAVDAIGPTVGRQRRTDLRRRRSRGAHVRCGWRPTRERRPSLTQTGRFVSQLIRTQLPRVLIWCRCGAGERQHRRHRYPPRPDWRDDADRGWARAKRDRVVGDGGVWVADTGDDAVVRIDPDTRAVTATIPVGQLSAVSRSAPARCGWQTAATGPNRIDRTPGG